MIYANFSMIKTILQRIFLLPNLVHELLHYLPAWWWGLQPRIDPNWSKMRHQRTTKAKTMVIILMPAITGLVCAPIIFYWISLKAPFYIAASIFWVGWMAACAKDIYKAIYIIRSNKWHN